MNNKNIIKLVLLVSLMSVAQLKADNMNKKIATFAGGCFWCVEQPFDKLKGVIESISGYTGGHEVSPTYEDVSAGTTGHLESVRIVYDPALIKYEQLLDLFWKQIDPTDPGGQFADRGHQYATAIFYHDEDQKKIAEKSKSKLDGSGIYGNPVVTRILPAGKFYAAEEYHQDYASKHPVKYKTYKHLSGRTPYIKKLWEKNIFETAAPQGRYQRPPDRKIKKVLNQLQYEVTQLNGTEKPFSNAYWDNKEEGIYVDIVTGEPLFSSSDKYKSDTGWPSFTRPLEPDNIVEKEDFKLFTKRTEVRSRNGDSHLGHVFDDGPAPTGMRYCVNSASLRFIPRKDLDKEGYGEYLQQFSD